VDCLHHGGDWDEATITLASQIAPTTMTTSVLATTVITAVLAGYSHPPGFWPK